MSITVTLTHKEKFEYFEYFTVGEEVELPDRPFAKEIADESLQIEQLSDKELKDALVTASYFGYKDRSIAEEFIWRIGNRIDTLNRYLETTTPEHYSILCYWNNSHTYQTRRTPMFKVRRATKDLEVRDALSYYYPGNINPLKDGIRRVESLDSLSIAYGGCLRLVKWYCSKNRGLGSSFAQNTVSLECLKYAESQGVNITKRHIHTSDPECEEYLKSRGAVHFAIDRELISRYVNCFTAAVNRNDIENIKRLYTPDIIESSHFSTPNINKETILFLVENCNLSIVELHTHSIVKDAKVDGIKLLISRGIPYQSLIHTSLVGGSESIRYIHSLGGRWSDISGMMLYKLSVESVKTLTELGFAWSENDLSKISVYGLVDTLKYLLTVVEYPIDKIILKSSRVFSNFHKANHPMIKKGLLPPRTNEINEITVTYIRKNIDPDY